MNMLIKNICCIGAGYVGGPTMAVLADKCPNLQINVVDLNENRINLWNSDDLSKLPVYEPGLSEIIARCRNINLFFSSDLQQNISKADMVFISVNTPTKTKGVGAGKASDLKWIDACARQISKFSRGKTIVVEKSTLPVKTAQTIKKILDEEVNKSSENYKEFFVLSNPEFLSEGTAINDLLEPDRVLIGGDDNDAIKSLESIYLNWIEKEKIIKTNLWSSELSKLVANAFLAQRISSINSISSLCEVTGADINDISLAVGTDRRIGEYFLNAGPGFGGSCFKKDILNLTYICEYYGLKEVASYWQKVIDINNWQNKRISELIVEKLFGTITGKKITILGFAFKANTNDIRESPAINICKELMLEGCHIYIYDPQVSPNQIESVLGKISKSTDDNNFDPDEGSWHFEESIYKAANSSDAIVITTEWNEFSNIDWSNLSKSMRRPAWVFDTRSIVDVSYLQSLGLNVWRVGLG
tara:strand:- start:20745 stop:22160 length:1416 start_codon:yes stop_codon:yes gene_type:complete